MVLLKKIKAASLMESLVASVIVLVLFVIASITINNLMLGSIRGNHTAIENQADELLYQAYHEHLNMPYYSEINGYEIRIFRSSHISLEIKRSGYLYNRTLPIVNEK